MSSHTGSPNICLLSFFFAFLRLLSLIQLRNIQINRGVYAGHCACDLFICG